MGLSVVCEGKGSKFYCNNKNNNNSNKNNNINNNNKKYKGKRCTMIDAAIPADRNGQEDAWKITT